jgi:acyl carrier protein
MSDDARSVRATPRIEVQDLRESALCSWLQCAVAKLLGCDPASVELDVRFRELGLSSVALTALVARLGEHAGLALLPTLAWECPTCRALARRIAGLSELSAGTAAVSGTATSGEVASLSIASGRAPIAIIGIACRLPGRIDSPEAYWNLLASGADAVCEVPIERWDVDALFDPDPSAPGKILSSASPSSSRGMPSRTAGSIPRHNAVSRSRSSSAPCGTTTRA